MGMCRWMGIDYNGVAFSTKFPTELLEWGHKLSGMWSPHTTTEKLKNGSNRVGSGKATHNGNKVRLFK